MPDHRDGKKFRGSHSTYTDLAAKVADILVKLDEVSGVSPGVIRSGKGMSGGSLKVKASNIRGGILLMVRQSRSVQELWVYTKNVQTTKNALAEALKSKNIPLAFLGE